MCRAPGWRDIDVVKHAGGSCDVALHGRARRRAEELKVRRILLSLSHDGDCAGAVVQVLLDEENHEHEHTH
jgi:phosphopantetheinyl transferase (holo-ACP synthase)